MFAIVVVTQSGTDDDAVHHGTTATVTPPEGDGAIVSVYLNLV
jgi:hypothetical protein